ncbi:hypothetical protein, conserved in T. vivax [Trypanosoma vivax Y486]|uniref:Uncharacterized protein n=1 Tax=Trypanosoma vivax (strain Y486) TaxID=1055687 RepID=F9WSI9_TRYVY|nr:hypothetical protein, conserved in T. vivax [Trypanosoma vivax Y486]|eukprot:CCD20528.1 hypothetical protein, conserved in T. vivax [Trypanosoma vivax Y486]
MAHALARQAKAKPLRLVCAVLCVSLVSVMALFLCSSVASSLFPSRESRAFPTRSLVGEFEFLWSCAFSVPLLVAAWSHLLAKSVASHAVALRGPSCGSLSSRNGVCAACVSVSAARLTEPLLSAPVALVTLLLSSVARLMSCASCFSSAAELGFSPFVCFCSSLISVPCDSTSQMPPQVPPWFVWLNMAFVPPFAVEKNGQLLFSAFTVAASLSVTEPAPPLAVCFFASVMRASRSQPSASASKHDLTLVSCLSTEFPAFPVSVTQPLPSALAPALYVTMVSMRPSILPARCMQSLASAVASCSAKFASVVPSSSLSPMCCLSLLFTSSAALRRRTSHSWLLPSPLCSASMARRVASTSAFAAIMLSRALTASSSAARAVFLSAVDSAHAPPAAALAIATVASAVPKKHATPITAMAAFVAVPHISLATFLSCANSAIPPTCQCAAAAPRWPDLAFGGGTESHPCPCERAPLRVQRTTSTRSVAAAMRAGNPLLCQTSARGRAAFHAARRPRTLLEVVTPRPRHTAAVGRSLSRAVRLLQVAGPASLAGSEVAGAPTVVLYVRAG